MSERLLIRLGASYDKPCQWMIWSEQESKIVDFGELPTSDDLHFIADQANDSLVDVFVSSAAITITQAPLPAKSQKQALKALPFMLEESLVDSIDNLHFVIGPKQGDKVDVLVVSHEQMQTWLSWLNDAGIKPRQLIPDCLSLPLIDSHWSALAIDNEYLLRTSVGQGVSIPKDWLSIVFPRMLEDREEPIAVSAYSSMELPVADLVSQAVELPILTLFRGLASAPVDLLTGAYKAKRELSKHFLIWKNAAIAAGICILLSLVNKGINIYMMDSQIAQIKAQSAQIYKQAVPGSTRIVNLRSQLGSELKRSQNHGSGSELFEMLKHLQQAFTQVPQLKPSSLRFDGSRNELRMQVTAVSFAQIEKFSELAKQHFKLDTGAINSKDDLVTSTLILRNL